MKKRALKAVAWSGTDILLRQGLQFAVTIVLARLLAPEDFGTIALLSVFTGIASVLVDGGISTALIQRQDINHADESTAFWFNLAMGAALGLFMLLLGPVVAVFFVMPVLEPLAALMGLNVVLAAAGAIHMALLAKQLDFRTQLKAGVIAAVVSGSIAITMALRGWGLWALASQMLVMTAVMTLLLWVFHRWRPAFVFSRASARKLFKFGGYVLTANLVDVIYVRAYTLLIGRFFGIRDLGLYERSEHTRQMPMSALTSVISRVALPLFATANSDKRRLGRGVQIAVRGLMLINVPMMLGLSALAEPLVLVLFGSQWLPAVPVLRVLCIAGALWPVQVINIQALLAQGDAKAVLKLEVPKKSLGVALLVAGAYYGVLGIAWSQVAFGIVAFALNAHYAGRFLGYGVAAQARDFAPVFLVSIPMALVIYYIADAWGASALVELVVLVAVGASLFLVSGWLLRLAALQDVVLLFRSAPRPPIEAV